jgi:putative CocE/NonD family hydrolase
MRTQAKMVTKSTTKVCVLSVAALATGLLACGSEGNPASDSPGSSPGASNSPLPPVNHDAGTTQPEAGAGPPVGTTTLGTRASENQPNPAIVDNATSSWATYSRPAQYPNARTLPLQFITTKSRDKLAVLVSVPADLFGNPVSGKFPVVLTQSAYRIDLGQLIGSVAPEGPTLMTGGRDAFLVERGYISVAVDVYGTGMSSGVTNVFGADEQAAYGDVVSWVTEQPWFDGNIGVAGTSYLSVTALLTAEQQNPAVKAVFADAPSGDLYRATAAPGGLLNANMLSAWMTISQNLAVANGAAELQNPSYASQIAAANQQHVDAIHQWFLPVINNTLNGQSGYATDDGSFWALRSPLESAKNIKAPTFIIGGTNDVFQRDEPLLYEQLKRNVNTKLLILPGGHLEAILDSFLSHDTPSDHGAPDAEALLLAWFDQYLKGIDTGAPTMPTVTQYVQGYGDAGTERYATTTDWPHPQATPQRMYLHGDMGLDTAVPTSAEASHTMKEPQVASVVVSTSSDGTLLQGKITINDGSDCSSSQVQWSMGLSGILANKACYTNNNQVEQSQNALLYSTAPLTSGLYINGPIEADIWMSATNTHAALVIRVDDVDSSGNATALTTGIQSTAHRAVDPKRSRFINGVMIQPWHPFTAASMLPLDANVPVLVPVEVFPVAALIKPGHRLRIAISASNQAEGVWPHPQQASADGNVTTILNDPTHPSSVVLPVVPADVLPL